MYNIQKQININEKYNKNFENIYNAIYNNNIDELIKLIDELIKNKNNKYKYLDYLLNPNIYKYVKIPNNFPLSTVTFQLHNIVKTKTNKKGNIGILFNPFFLYTDSLYNNTTVSNNTNFYNNNGTYYNFNYINNNKDKNWDNFYTILYLSTLSINNSDSSDELYNIYWYPYNINQNVKYFSSYRLVSSEIVVKYIGPEIESSGSFYGCVLNNDNNYINGFIANIIQNDGNISVNYNEYVNLHNIEYNKLNIVYNSYYYKQIKCNEGIKLIYYPIDNTFEEFIKPLNINDLYYYYNRNDDIRYSLLCKQNYKNNFNFLIIGNDLPFNDNKEYIQIEIICNFECFTKTEYLNYMPNNLNNINLNINEKNDIINLINKNNIFKADENTFLNIN